MYLCNLIGAELSMQDGELFHSWSCSVMNLQTFGKGNMFEFKAFKSKAASVPREPNLEKFCRAACLSKCISASGRCQTVAVAILDIKFPWPFERVGEARAAHCK